MNRRSRPAVVAVVIALSHREQAHQPVFVTAVSSGVRPRAPGVAHRVDASGNVMNEEHPHESTPDQTLPASDEKRNAQAEHDPDEKRTVNKRRDPISSCAEHTPGMQLSRPDRGGRRSPPNQVCGRW